ncbi:MAG: flippase [Patescibacteria group bacterium]|nr:flippase [Patescibacteria group bacterium]
MRLSTKVAYNTIVQVISKIIATGLGLAVIAIMARYLGKEGFGQYTIIITFLSFFAIIADMGLTLVTVQMISRPGVDQDKILSNLFSMRLISAVIFLGLAPLIIIFFPYDPIIKLGVAVTTLSFFFIALNQILVGLFQKNLRMDKVSIAEVVSRIVLVAGVALVWRFDLGLINIMTATVVASAVNFLLHFQFSRKFVRIKLRFDFIVWRAIIKRSWPLALTIIFNLIYLKADTLILSLIKSQSEVGIYGATYKVIDVLITFPFMFAGIVLPIMTARWAIGDKSGFKNAMQKSYDVMVIMAFPLVIGAQFTAKRIMVLVAGQEFALSGPILRILILAAGLIFIGCVFAHGVIAINKQRKMIGAYIFTAVTALVGYLIFIPEYSYFGAAWVAIYSETVVVIASVYLIWRFTKFLPNLEITGKSLLASAIMAAGLYLTAGWNLFIVLSLAVIVYFTALYVLKGIKKQDIIELMNR